MDHSSLVSGSRFVMGHATDTTWQKAARRVAEQLGDRDEDDVGFVYVTDHFANHLGDITSFLSAATGTLHWCGTIGIGICATCVEYFDRPGIVAMTCNLPGSGINTFTSVDEAITAYSELGAGPGGAFGIVHGDPRREELVSDIPRLARDTDGFLVGGLTSSRGAFGTIAGHPADNSLSGLLVTDARVAAGLTQGCSPLGGYHQVTDAKDNVVLGLDDRPAMDVFVEVLAEAGVTDLRSLSGALHVALPVTGSDMGDYLVRNLLELDPEARSIVIGDHVQEGDALMFCRRDREAAETDLRRMLHDMKARALKPCGGLYFSCLARGPNLFGDEGNEMKIVQEVLGDIPIVGFFGNGEISFDRLYAYTGVLTLFLEAEPELH
ncbi:MAG: FIST C-terminal domain-containing protein [Rhodospirillales bacterium]|nr:FIST C-terminal domain-containing protein [Rhodospirillales bacterium]